MDPTLPTKPEYSSTAAPIVTSYDAHGHTHRLHQLQTGTVEDAADMHRLGKTQELRRNFRSISILGLSSVVMATWLAFLSTASFSLINGGLAGTVWMFLGVWVCTVPVTASLADMASM